MLVVPKSTSKHSKVALYLFYRNESVNRRIKAFDFMAWKSRYDLLLRRIFFWIWLVFLKLILSEEANCMRSPPRASLIAWFSMLEIAVIISAFHFKWLAIVISALLWSASFASSIPSPTLVRRAAWLRVLEPCEWLRKCCMGANQVRKDQYFLIASCTAKYKAKRQSIKLAIWSWPYLTGECRRPKFRWNQLLQPVRLPYLASNLASWVSLARNDA